MLTTQQTRLLKVVEYRRVHGLPTVQRDLAEALGIRRDSLNKLLARTRKALAARGEELRMPCRTRSAVIELTSLETLRN